MLDKHIKNDFNKSINELPTNPFLSEKKVSNELPFLQHQTRTIKINKFFISKKSSKHYKISYQTVRTIKLGPVGGR